MLKKKLPNEKRKILKLFSIEKKVREMSFLGNDAKDYE
jgi:hypothetical protein